MFFIQSCYRQGYIYSEESFEGSDEEVILRAKKVHLLDEIACEGDYTRVITSDGELVWDSRKEQS